MARGPKTYEFNLGRVLVAAAIFTAILSWQADLAWNWWLPAFFLISVVFALMHAFYNWANLRLNEMGRRAREVEDQL
ncbi:MAG: hypothetical protein GX859_11095 [Corynebacterium humireducens]|jgi:hypothetical protein|uniref:Uncharacterized protein n=1 Tax=Corynebacterium humireducens TaxID=1223514 RepID=A0A7X6PPM5_9CORY|nr:hypothetical protein [Corynebacterium sp.]NLA56815.1 hypothetical protein [Corynebacterium humireducens]HHU68424.1 hypothetical protein [Corynebacterium sp.]HKM25442.1 hypothetical protein [Corynebacterium sp.]